MHSSTQGHFYDLFLVKQLKFCTTVTNAIRPAARPAGGSEARAPDKHSEVVLVVAPLDNGWRKRIRRRVDNDV